MTLNHSSQNWIQPSGSIKNLSSDLFEYSRKSDILELERIIQIGPKLTKIDQESL